MRLFVQSAICTSRANCQKCRDPERGLAMWALWGKHLQMPPEWADGCPLNFPVGWKNSDDPAPVRRRRRIKLEIVVPPAVADQRRASCAACASNAMGVCLKLHAIHPLRPAIIERGVWMPHARCPGEPSQWGRWPRA